VWEKITETPVSISRKPPPLPANLKTQGSSARPSSRSFFLASLRELHLDCGTSLRCFISVGWLGKKKCCSLKGALPQHLPNLPVNSRELPPKRQHIRSLSSLGFRIPLRRENRSERTRSRSEKPIFSATGIILPRPPNRELP